MVVRVEVVARVGAARAGAAEVAVALAVFI